MRYGIISSGTRRTSTFVYTYTNCSLCNNGSMKIKCSTLCERICASVCCCEVASMTTTTEIECRSRPTCDFIKCYYPWSLRIFDRKTCAPGFKRPHIKMTMRQSILAQQQTCIASVGKTFSHEKARV